MTKRTLVGYWRDCWSWLITGAAKDKTTLSPSCAAPSKYEEKNMGQLNMANPFVSENKNCFNVANPAMNSCLGFMQVEKADKLKKQIDAFAQLKAKRKSNR